MMFDHLNDMFELVYEMNKELVDSTRVSEHFTFELVTDGGEFSIILFAHSANLVLFQSDECFDEDLDKALEEGQMNLKNCVREMCLRRIHVYEAHLFELITSPIYSQDKDKK